MYKYFNAASGAVLAGPKALLADLYHPRRMFGGGLQQVWPFAAVALHYIDGFEQRFRSAVETSEKVISALSTDGNFELQRFPNGTNIFRMHVYNVNASVYHVRLESAGITARAPDGDWFTLQVNETWARVPASEIIARFRKALGLCLRPFPAYHASFPLSTLWSMRIERASAGGLLLLLAPGAIALPKLIERVC